MFLLHFVLHVSTTGDSFLCANNHVLDYVDKCGTGVATYDV